MDIDRLLARGLGKTLYVVAADDEGAVVYVNELAASLFGGTSERLAGKNLEAVLAGDAGNIRGFWPTLRAGATWTGTIARREGSGFHWLRGAVVPVEDEGKKYFLAIGNPSDAKAAGPDLGDAVDLHELMPYALHSLDTEGRILQVNQTWLTWLGYERAEAEGKLFFRDTITPESYSTFLANFPQFKERGAVRDLEFTFRRKDGSTFPGLVSATAIKDAAGQFVQSRSVIMDLSERKRAEAAATLLHQRLSSAVEAVSDPIAIWDAQDKLVSCNSTYRRMLLEGVMGPVIGLSFEEILDRTMAASLVDPSDPNIANYREKRREYRKDPKGYFEVRRSDKVVLRMFERRTPEGGLVSIAWDISDDVRKTEELHEARQTADRANAAKSEFLSSMSHELRTPLNAVLGFAQLLQRDKNPALTPKQQGYLKHVLRGGEHLLKLIDEVLDLTRVESGNVPLSTEPVVVEEVLSEVHVTLGPMAQGRGIELSVAPVPAGLPLVHVDRTRFSQILLNYGSNGIKYNRAAGQVAFVAAQTPAGNVRVTVVDTGLGIAKERQTELFQPFHRLGQEAGPIEGTGIGLTIVKRLAEMMGGKVGVHSTPGKGSEFWVEFPALPVEKRREAAAESSRPRGSEGKLAGDRKKHRVLYIEDNPQNVVLMQELLATLEQFDLLTAPTAEIGIELARAHSPDIVVLDINLPGMSGYEALAELRRLPETKAIPVVALSASAMDRDIRRAEQAGFAKYLTKPVKIEELCDTLERFVGAQA